MPEFGYVLLQANVAVFGRGNDIGEFLEHTEYAAGIVEEFVFPRIELLG